MLTWDEVVDVIKNKSFFKESSFDITDPGVGAASDIQLEQIAIQLALTETAKQEKPDSLCVQKNELKEMVPQPKIGAVLRCGNTIFCSSRSGRRVGDHAEFTVINAAKDKINLKETTLYTTLEPCTPDSRSKWTSSCSTLITEYGIPEVFIGTIDANPLVTGAGLKGLLDAKVKVHLFDPSLAEDLENINSAFFAFFKKMPDLKAIKKVFTYIVPDLDINAVQYYCQQKNLLDKDEKITIEVLAKFLSLMIDERQISESDDLQKVDVTDEFALLFYEYPNKKIPGYRVNIYTKDKKINTTDNSGINTERKPLRKNLLRTLTANIEGTDDSTNIFVRIIKEVNGKTRVIKNDDDVGKALVQIVDNETAVRELVINALVHNNYRLSPVINFIFKTNEVEILNAIDLQGMNEEEKKTLETALNKGEVYSQPVNHFIMDVLEECHLTEQFSLGMKAVESNPKNILKNYEEGAKGKTIFSIVKDGFIDSMDTRFSINKAND